MGIKSSGIACPTAAPNVDIACDSVKPAKIKRIGKIIETNETASEFAVRIAVIGRADFNNGLNSFFGFLSLFFLTKNTMLASVNEKR